MAEPKREQQTIVRVGGRGGPMTGRANVQKPHDMKKTLIRLFKYIGKSRIVLISLLVLMLVITIIEIAGPKFQQLAIDSISYVDNKLTVDFDTMKKNLFIMLVIFLVDAALTYVQGLLSAKLSQTTVHDMRGDIFAKISKLPIRYTDTHRHGDIMSRLANDTENISNAISQSITTLFSAVLTLVGALIMMLYYSPLLTVIAVITVPITIFVSTKLASFMRKYFKQQQQLLGELNGNVEETVTGYRTVVAYGKEDDSLNRFSETADKLRDCSIRARVWGSIMGPIMNFLGNLQYVLIAAIGGFMVISGADMTVGGIQAMLQYSKKFSHPINMIANQYSAILTALAGAERIFEILDSDDEIDEGTNPITPEEIRGDIEFTDMRFGYEPNEPVLKGMNLSVKAGQKIAIVGATGSGKTTVANLLTRFYELDGGTITIDGIDIRDIPKSTLRHTIAVVLQDAALFSGTIDANIRYGRPDADFESVKNAAHAAMADTFIERLPDKYNAVLAESGANLSQGQRQLLAIARAFLAKPRILILDEATSSVDTRTETRIQVALENLMRGNTSLIIAHRLSTIRNADMIVVVSGGVIVESGSHEELLAKRGEYYSLYSRQFAGNAT